MQTETKIGAGWIYKRMNIQSLIVLFVSSVVLFAHAGLVHTLLPMPPHFLDPANHSQLARSLGFNLLASIYMFIAYKEDNVYRTITEKVSAATHTVVFKDVPYGTYAVSVYQDVNSNGKMDMGLFGPLEPYGFSNNAKASLSPPPFSKAAFTVDSERCAITIELVH